MVATARRKQEPTGRSRAEQKQLTRQALLDATLELLRDKSFDSLSLREITRHVGIVPTAFYRHFEDVGELGLVLVVEAFGALRRMMRVAREAPLPTDELVHRSVEMFGHYVQAHEPYFRFVARERYGGSPLLRQAIRAEIARFVQELASDLGRFSPLDRWKATDRQMLAGLLVRIMIGAVERLLDGVAAEANEAQPALASSSPEQNRREVSEWAEKQIRLVLLGAEAWTP